MKRIIVPEGMIKAVHEFLWQRWGYDKTIGDSDIRPLGHPEWNNIDGAIEAALEWLSYNPIVPSETQIDELNEARRVDPLRKDLFVHWICSEWQRRMFLAPELKIPDGVEDLMWSETLYAGDTGFHKAIPNINKAIVEAFHRGQKAGSNERE